MGLCISGKKYTIYSSVYMFAGLHIYGNKFKMLRLIGLCLSGEKCIGNRSIGQYISIMEEVPADDGLSLQEWCQTCVEKHNSVTYLSLYICLSKSSKLSYVCNRLCVTQTSSLYQTFHALLACVNKCGRLRVCV